VQAEFVTRLKAFKARMKGERVTTLMANLKALKAENKAYSPLVDAVGT
jgi:hypothetical protein